MRYATMNLARTMFHNKSVTSILTSLFEYKGPQTDESKKKGEKASHWGNETHKMVEMVFKDKMPLGNYPYYANKYLTDIQTVELQATYNSIFQWIIAHPDYDPVEIEFHIKDKETGICGTLDALFRNRKTNKCVLVEWKYSDKDFNLLGTDNIWNFVTHPTFCYLPNTAGMKYAFQLNLYKQLLERNTNYTVDEMYIVQLKAGVCITTPVATIPDMKAIFDYNKN